MTGSSTLTDAQIIRLLDVTGHLRRPFGAPDQGPWPAADLEALTLQASEARAAVASYQAMYSQQLSELIAKHHPDRRSPAPVIDGEVGPATMELLSMPRCECADYAAELEEPLLGAGNWRGCYGIGQFHSAVVKFMNAAPDFLAPQLDAVWVRVVQAYDEIGLRLTRDDQSDHANIEVSFVVPDGGWIGLAIVGQGQTCGTTIWARFDRSYRPANVLSEWTTLIKHELGHNCGLQHSNGGVMNPYIVAGLPVSWKNDVSYPLLKRLYGGEPVPGSRMERELVAGYLYQDGHFEKLMTIPQSAVTGPFQSG